MLYKRVQRSMEAPYELEPVGKGENPFSKGPCLLCLAAHVDLQSNNGILRTGMQYARIRTSKDNASTVCASDSGITFCTYDRVSGDSIDNLFNTCFLPIIESTNDKEKLAKTFRNINIMSYCDAYREVTLLLNKIEGALLNKKVFLPEDIKSIMQNIVCIQIAGHYIKNANATTFMVGDRQDPEGGIRTLPTICNALDNSGMQDNAAILSYGNKHFIAIDKNSIHSFDYLKDKQKGEIMRAILPTLVTEVLENSRQNAKSEKLIPLEIAEILSNLQKIMDNITKKEKTSDNEILTSDKVLADLDKKVYAGCQRASLTKLGLLKTADKQIKLRFKIIKQLQENIDDIPIRVKYAQSTREKFVEALSKLVNEETLKYIISGEGNPEEISHKNSGRSKSNMSDDVKTSVYHLVRSYSRMTKSFEEQERNKSQESAYQETLLEGVPKDCRELVDELQRMGRIMFEKKAVLIKNEKEALDEEEKTRELIKRIVEVVTPDLMIEMIQVADPNVLNQCTLIEEYIKEKAKNNSEVEM
jgi:hypothetical protein